MEDFFKKYRKNTRKTVKIESEVDSPRRPVVEKPRRKRTETVYFVDMNHDELPLPNTVRQAVKVFEEPVKTEHNSTKPDFDEMTSSEGPPRARDVVQKFEAKIKSSAPQKPPRPTRQNGAGLNESLGPPNGNASFGRQNAPSKPRKPAILSPASDSHTRKESKHVSFVENGPLNLVVQNDGSTNLDSIRDDLKTVTINTNKSIIIKTV
uniref:Uncharacterized protein n=1 Tax=Lygus hesperus TaxID=30085 RepID=A0A0K8THF4_LYGHE